MSWSIEEHIGDFRPFPVQVVVCNGETGECLAYVSGEVADRLRAENAKLRELLADTLMQPRDYCQKYGIEYESWDSANVHLDARLRELGIEMD